MVLASFGAVSSAMQFLWLRNTSRVHDLCCAFQFGRSPHKWPTTSTVRNRSGGASFRPINFWRWASQTPRRMVRTKGKSEKNDRSHLHRHRRLPQTTCWCSLPGWPYGRKPIWWLCFRNRSSSSTWHRAKLLSCRSSWKLTKTGRKAPRPSPCGTAWLSGWWRRSWKDWRSSISHRLQRRSLWNAPNLVWSTPIGQCRIWDGINLPANWLRAKRRLYPLERWGRPCRTWWGSYRPTIWWCCAFMPWPNCLRKKLRPRQFHFCWQLEAGRMENCGTYCTASHITPFGSLPFLPCGHRHSKEAILESSSRRCYERLERWPGQKVGTSFAQHHRHCLLHQCFLSGAMLVHLAYQWIGADWMAFWFWTDEGIDSMVMRTVECAALPTFSVAADWGLDRWWTFGTTRHHGIWNHFAFSNEAKVYLLPLDYTRPTCDKRSCHQSGQWKWTTALANYAAFSKRQCPCLQFEWLDWTVAWSPRSLPCNWPGQTVPYSHAGSTCPRFESEVSTKSWHCGRDCSLSMFGFRDRRNFVHQIWHCCDFLSRG